MVTKATKVVTEDEKMRRLSLLGDKFMDVAQLWRKDEGHQKPEEPDASDKQVYEEMLHTSIQLHQRQKNTEAYAHQTKLAQVIRQYILPKAILGAIKKQSSHLVHFSEFRLDPVFTPVIRKYMANEKLMNDLSTNPRIIDAFFEDNDNPTSTINSHITNSPTNAVSPIQAITPDKSIKHASDCGAAAELVLLQAMADIIGDEKFNAVFGYANADANTNTDGFKFGIVGRGPADVQSPIHIFTTPSFDFEVGTRCWIDGVQGYRQRHPLGVGNGMHAIVAGSLANEPLFWSIDLPKPSSMEDVNKLFEVDFIRPRTVVEEEWLLRQPLVPGNDRKNDKTITWPVPRVDMTYADILCPEVLAFMVVMPTKRLTKQTIYAAKMRGLTKSMMQLIGSPISTL